MGGISHMNCWEYKNCGRDKTKDCPAFPLNGKTCWLSAGTLCGGQIQGTFAQKIGNCSRCDFYQATNGKHMKERLADLSHPRG